MSMQNWGNSFSDVTSPTGTSDQRLWL